MSEETSEGPDAAWFHRLQAGRRMCRDFSGAPLDESVVARLVDAALGAPAAGNTHGLDLLLLRDADPQRYWQATMDPARRRGFRWQGLFAAPLLIVPYVDPDAYAQRYSGADKSHSGLGDVGRWSVPYWFVDGGAAVMALLLAAEAEGLGALLFGQFDHEAVVREAFGVPEDRRAVGTIALGHPRVAGRSRSTSALRGRPNAAERVHRGAWGGTSR